MGSDRQDISILVACKRIMICELYLQTLNRHSGFRVVTCATTVDEVLRSVQETEIDVALISTTLTDGPRSGISVLQSLHESNPNVRSVLMFDPDESHLIVSAFRAGARGVFGVGQEVFKSLCRCVERVHAGQIWANSAQLTQVLDALLQQPNSRLVSQDGLRLLTKREDEVVRLVEEGFTNRAIAGELHLSEHTVRNNLFRIFDKLGVSTRVELALYAINNSKANLASSINEIDKEIELTIVKSSFNRSVRTFVSAM